ncbi:glycoside hydrolase family 10 protein [Thorsellia anophelis]|uniref:Glycosyl hydrolase-like 10 n=1 Tax=Thorsellia anophelis DSM 18579 TaxID=1123402 RepID=A0A1I0AVR3_9GAMM|nr:family 10 glycosylhydrolase [Thorsellia anophelis]SES98505.1 Glycosyl hydrolase-like 10 [Thorsellia anophelis DSM 18579]
MKRNNILKLSTITLALSLILTGCDSGGGSDSAPPAPPKPPTLPELSTTMCRLPTNENGKNTDFIALDPLASLAELKAFNSVSNQQDGAGVTLFNSLHFPTETNSTIEIPTEYKASKHQFRGSYVSTHFNLDIKPSTSSADFKSKFTKILNEAEALKMNAIVFQVRPNADAWYKSEINPWAATLSQKGTGPGRQGVSELGGFDPLEYMLEQTHNKGMEYHAWINPFRAASSITQNFDNKTLIIEDLIASGKLSEDNFLVDNVDKTYINLTTGTSTTGILAYDPSNQDVQAHIIDTVKELLKYDIDAIHFDDYFYLGNTTASDYMNQFDYQTFLTSGNSDSFANFEQWRRDNITEFITKVQTTIKDHNDSHGTSVQFGIAPSGNWGNTPAQEDGARTRASISYAGTIYADTKKWLSEGLIDYLAPQIYWPFAHPSAPYGEIATWWNGVAEDKNPSSNTQLYIAHEITRLAPYTPEGTDSADTLTVKQAWANPMEIANQLRYNQILPQIEGGIFWRHDYTNGSKNSVVSSSMGTLKNQYWNAYAIPPEKPWLDQNNAVPNSPIEATFIINNINATSFTEFQWKDDNNEDARYFVIYKGMGEPENIFKNPNNIIAKVPVTAEKKNGFYTFEDNSPLTPQSTYLISTVDRASRESEATEVLISKTIIEQKQLICE